MKASNFMRWMDGSGPMMTREEVLARRAIEAGKTMGQFLRDLPNSNTMTREELQAYAKAYAAVRENPQARTEN